MIEGYSISTLVETDTPIPFNNVSLLKGGTVIFVSPTTIQFNKKGVYMVSVNTSGIPSANGVMSIQLSKNGVAQPQAQSSTQGTTTEVSNMDFTTLVQVPADNNPCCCSVNPTLIQVLNTGVETTHTCNICVTKIC